MSERTRERGHDLRVVRLRQRIPWLRKFAWTNQQADAAKTYVALDGDCVAGYYALTTGSVRKHESPQRIAKGLANHPVGIVLLARLAVDRTQQGPGLGKALLFDALSRIEDAADIVGVRAVLFMPLTRPHGASICTLSLRSRRSIPISCGYSSRIFGKQSMRERSHGCNRSRFEKSGILVHRTSSMARLLAGGLDHIVQHESASTSAGCTPNVRDTFYRRG